MSATLRELARAAAGAIAAFDAASAEARRDMGTGALILCRDTREAAETALEAYAEALYDRGRVMLGDDVYAYLGRVRLGIVVGAWAIRCVAMAEEVGGG